MYKLPTDELFAKALDEARAQGELLYANETKRIVVVHRESGEAVMRAFLRSRAI